jgi:uncharacterized FlgJ-related protein
VNAKDDRAYLEHMRECIERIDEYTQADRNRFYGSRMIQDAVVMNLQTLAESSQRVSTEVKSNNPKIPWREMSGFRNILVPATGGRGGLHGRALSASYSGTGKMARCPAVSDLGKVKGQC